MLPRAQLLAVLVVIELAIVGGMVNAVRGDQPGPSLLPGPRLVEDGPHQVFYAGAHPSLTVDIGYADLTILTRSGAQVDVAVSKSTDFGPFRATAPITARQDGGTIRIATTAGRGWSVGDDRMVTVLVPPGTQVAVINAGDISATGLRAEASFHAVGRGSITIADFDAPTLRVTASNGPISLQQIITTRLDATSRKDRVEGTALQVRDGLIESDDAVSLGFAPGADTMLTAQTSGGVVRAAGFAVVPSVITASKGSDDDASSQILRIGTGAGHLDVHSRSGDIDLSQQG